MCVTLSALLQDGNTALHEASRNGYTEVVQLLLKASCFADGYNNQGMNSLHLAAQHGHASVVKTLLKHKSNPLLANKVWTNRMPPCSCGYDLRTLSILLLHIQRRG